MELINLKNLSFTTIALQIWENPNIKDQVRDFFFVRQSDVYKFRKHNNQSGFYLVKEMFNYYEIKEHYVNFQSIIQSAILNLDLLELPLELKNSCKIAVQELGGKIYEWCEYVTETLKFDFKFAEKIYFKLDGTLDEDKIFTTWENNDEFLNHKTPISPAMHILACVSVNEDFIARSQFEMEKHLKIFMPQFDLSKYNNKIYTIVAMYLYLHITNEIYQIDEPINGNYIISPHEIFLLCARSGYTKAASYFYKYIPFPLLPEIFQDCLEEMDFYFKSEYQREKASEMIISLIDQMTVEQKTSLLQKSDNAVKIFCRILLAKSNHEIISELMENYFLGLSDSDYREILQEIFNLINEYSHESTKHKNMYFCSLVHKILTRLPEDLKSTIFNGFFLEMPCRISDMNILKLILNYTDPEIRAKILKVFRHAVMLVVKNKQMDKLDEFMNHILISEEERNFFKINLLDQFLMDAKFEIVNELFNYFSMPAEEVKSFNERVNNTSILKSFLLSWRYDKAEKFLERMFPDEDKRENYRNSLPENLFIYEKTFKKSDKIINGCLGKEANSKDFYNYFFGFPDEEKSVKNPELYRSFRERLENIKEENYNRASHNHFYSQIWLKKKFLKGKMFLKRFHNLYDETELPNLYMKWICHDKNRREAIKRKYASDVEEEFFGKLIIFLFGEPKHRQKWRLISLI